MAADVVTLLSSNLLEFRLNKHNLKPADLLIRSSCFVGFRVGNYPLATSKSKGLI